MQSHTNFFYNYTNFAIFMQHGTFFAQYCFRWFLPWKSAPSCVACFKAAQYCFRIPEFCGLPLHWFCRTESAEYKVSNSLRRTALNQKRSTPISLVLRNTVRSLNFATSTKFRHETICLQTLYVLHKSFLTHNKKGHPEWSKLHTPNALSHLQVARISGHTPRCGFPLSW